MKKNSNVQTFSFMSGERPVLKAEIIGGAEYSDIRGEAYVYFFPEGIYLQADFDDLPPNNEFGFHVHEGRCAKRAAKSCCLCPIYIPIKTEWRQCRSTSTRPPQRRSRESLLLFILNAQTEKASLPRLADY